MSPDPAARPHGPAMCIRLDPRPAEIGGPEGHGSGSVLAALRRVVGCRWIWWAPDPRTAWDGVLAALGVWSRRHIVVPVGLDPVVAQALRGGGATLVEVDLDPSSGFALWQTAPAGRPAGDSVYLVEHRHGRPSPIPPVEDDGIVLEHATDGVGGTVGDRPVGSLGAAGVIALGHPPLARSIGALVVTDDASSAARLGAAFSPLESEIGRAGGLGQEAARVEGWVDGCRAAAQVYSSAWRGARLPVRPVMPAPETEPSWSTYLAVIPDPDAVVRVLADHGVEARRPVPPGRIPPPSPGPGGRGAAAFYQEIVRLPNHPDLGLGELLYVADAVRVNLRAAQRGAADGRDVPRGSGTSDSSVWQ
jgi:hypothetical protein